MASNEKIEIRIYNNEYKKKDNHPNKTGNGEISKGALKKLVDKIKAEGGDSIEIQAAAWERVSQKGTPYLYLTIEPKMKKEDGASPF
jgi:hypothetical protein